MITNKLFKKILLLVFLSLFIAGARAETVSFPFTDIKPNDELYKDLKTLYSNNVIKDSPDHLFRPDSLITRDEFLGIVIGVGCKDCINPTTEDFIKYDSSPFVDLSKFNPYYYCIASGKESKITQGYLLDSKGEYTCQNKKTFTSTPFCPENNTTRIEAVAMLLRIANLWDDTKNSTVAHDVLIKDVDNNWYGFAKKGIEARLLKIDAEGKVYPNEYINRREFVHMATKVFGINLCESKNLFSTKGLSSDIQIFDKTNPDSCSGNGTQTNFADQKENTYDFHAYTENKGDFEYSWEFTNTTTGETKKMSGPCLDDMTMPDGKWIIKSTIKDKATGETSQSFTQITVSKNTTSSGISADIKATPIFGEGPLGVNFNSTVTGGKGNTVKTWDFGDGQTSTLSNPSHTYSTPGIYTVTLRVIDESGNTGISQLTIEVAETVDSDNDGVKDKLDKCPQIVGPALNSGCPVVDEYKKPGSNNLTNGNNGGNNNNEEISAEIKIFDKTNAQSSKGIGSLSQFDDKKETVYDFYAHTETPGNLEYKWEFTNTTTKEKISANGKFLDNFDLETNGIWIAKLTIKDKDTGKEAISTSQISITDKPTSGGSNDNSNNLTVNIDSNLLVGISPITVDLKGIVQGAEGDVQYKWNFGDGQTSTSQNPSHTYQIPGVYTITLTATDAKGNTGTSQIVVVIKGNNLSWNNSGSDGIGNLCISEKAKGKGTIEGLLECNSCPCSFSLSYLASIRSCDIIFPAISSPDKKTLYSRGSIYQIK